MSIHFQEEMGDEMMAVGNLQMACTLYRKCLQEESAHERVYEKLGNALEEAGQLTQALEVYEAWIDTLNDSQELGYDRKAQAYAAAGIVSMGLQDADQAASKLTQSLEHARLSQDNNLLQLALNLLATLEASREHWSTAEQYLESIIEIECNHAKLCELHNNLGLVVARQGRFQEALEVFDTAAACLRHEQSQETKNEEEEGELLESTVPVMLTNWYLKGETLMEMGQDIAAIEMLEKALVGFNEAMGETPSPVIASIFEKLGELSRKRNLWDAAETYLSLAVEEKTLCYGVDHPETIRCQNQLEELSQHIQK